MSINKAQGQSLSHIGVDLRAQVFAHGQLYVALSRTTNADNVSVLVSTDNKEHTVDNVVWPEVLTSVPRPRAQRVVQHF